MASCPEPQVGLEGRKDRPCAIVVAIETSKPKSRKQVAVVPITHRPSHDPRVSIEIPRRVKEHLGLDGERSWVVLNEFNVFTWPGFDLRPIKGRDSRVDYGFLPPRFFDRLIARIQELEKEGGEIARTSRDE